MNILIAIAREAGIWLSEDDVEEVLYDLRYDPALMSALEADGYLDEDECGPDALLAALEAASRGGDAVRTVLVLRTKFGLPPFA